MVYPNTCMTFCIHQHAVSLGPWFVHKLCLVNNYYQLTDGYELVFIGTQVCSSCVINFAFDFM